MHFRGLFYSVMQSNPTSAMGRRFLIVSSGILLSRCLGLARDILFARVWGTETAVAAFILAFTIPNLLRALFGEGAFNAAFVPLFTRRLQNSGPSEARRLACRILSSVAVVLAVTTALVVGFSLVMRGIADEPLPRLTFAFLAWLMPYSILICLTAGLGAILNSTDRFTVPAYSQALLNACIILAAAAISPLFGSSSITRMYVVIGGVLTAGILQLSLHLCALLRQGWRFRFEPSFRDPEVMRFGVLLTPILMGVGVVQVNVVVDRLLAGYLGSTETAVLYYSQRLAYLPVGLFGVALSIVVLPAMAKACARDDHAALLANLSQALRFVVFLTVPCVTLLLTLRIPVIRLLFERGRFDAAATRETAWTLLFYLGGIPAFACAKIATTPFHARQDTRTPVKIAVVCMVLNVALNLLLMRYLRQGGLALATSICSYVNILLLFACLKRQIGDLCLRAVGPCLAKVIVAAVAAAAVAAIVLDLPALDSLPAALGRFAQLVLPLAAGGITFVATAAVLRSRELAVLTQGLLTLFGKRR